MSRSLSVALFTAALTLLAAPGSVQAQAERQFEVSGSFSYLFADVDGSGVGDVGGVGFHGGFAFFINDWLGVGAEAGYNSGDLDVPVIQIFPTPEVDFTQWTLLFGPRFRIAESDRFRVGAQTLAGIARGSTDVEIDLSDVSFGPPGGPTFSLQAFDFSFASTTFAALFGLHFDLRIDDRLAWRIVEPGVLVTGYGGEGQAHFRVSSGLTFGF